VQYRKNGKEMEYQTFKIESDTIPGFNEMIKAAKTFGAKRTKFNAYAAMKKAWAQRIGIVIRENNIFHIDKLFLHLIWYEPNKRRDPDNIAAFIKFILDALQKEKVIANDGWNNIAGWQNEFVLTDHRGVEVRLYEQKGSVEQKNKALQKKSREKHKVFKNEL
jgi:Holliday junction resolvase RusA-like endonuclease